MAIMDTHVQLLGQLCSPDPDPLDKCSLDLSDKCSFMDTPDWFKVFLDDGETTVATSDTWGDITSGGSDDDEASSATPPGASYPSLPELADDPFDRQMAQPAWSLAAEEAAARSLLPELGLVDLDPAEGRRRGRELLAMLQSVEDTDGPLTPPPPPPPRQRQPPPPPPPPAQKAHGPLAARACLSAKADMFVPSSFSSTKALPQYPQSLTGPAGTIPEAARVTFGEDLAEVKGSVCAGFVVRLRPKRWDIGTALGMLAASLGMLPDVVAVEPAREIPSSGLLRIHCIDEGLGEQQCWEFVNRGSCPRGNACRWRHGLQTRAVTVVVGDC